MRALLFVIGGAGVVDDVVEPDGEFDGSGVFRFVAAGLEFVETIGDVAEVVIGEARFRVGVAEFGPLIVPIDPNS